VSPDRAPASCNRTTVSRDRASASYNRTTVSRDRASASYNRTTLSRDLQLHDVHFGVSFITAPTAFTQ